MYFFKADISSFDDEAETVFIIPEQNADENGVPFEEKMITQTAEYKAFVKRTKTALVDCTYTQYQTDEPIADGLNPEKFAQLEAEGKALYPDSQLFDCVTVFDCLGDNAWLLAPLTPAQRQRIREELAEWNLQKNWADQEILDSFRLIMTDKGENANETDNL